MAPTGSAASLISGSTYHSMLGFSKYGESNETSLTNVRDRLKDVDYMFIDEISMVDCNHFYDISARLCRIFNNDGEPFGGKNMIFAGDFAQLEPPGYWLQRASGRFQRPKSSSMKSSKIYRTKIHT